MEIWDGDPHGGGIGPAARRDIIEHIYGTHGVLLAFAVARLRPDAFSNSVEPGWVATKMGGPTAPDDLNQGPVTQAWLAAGDDLAANVTAHHFYHQQIRQPHPQARNPEVQNALVAGQMALCASLLAGAGLLARSLWEMTTAPLGASLPRGTA